MHSIGTEQQNDKYRNHAQVWELLPWYINGSLADEDQRQISEHAAVCLICRKELGLQAALRESVKSHELDEVMVTASFEHLSAKLLDQDPGLPPLHSPADRGKNPGEFAAALKLWLQQRFSSAYLVAALSALAIVAILPWFAAELFPATNTFKTLSNTLTETSVTADLRLIFADNVSESDRDLILDGAGLSIVSGPDDRGLYFVDADDVSAGALAETLRQLRSNEKVLFAEFVISPAADSPLLEPQ